jgi:hypothetical protein
MLGPRAEFINGREIAPPKIRAADRAKGGFAKASGNGLAKTPLAKVKEPAESLAPVLEQVRAHSAIWRSIDLIGERFVTVGRFRKWVKPLTVNDFQQFQRLIRFDP